MAARGPLAEREHELRSIAAAMSSARSHTGRLLIVEGPAGCGRSTLAEAAVGCARRSGMRVALASGSKLEEQFPFGTALRILEPLLRDLSSEERAQVLSGAASMAQRVLELDVDLSVQADRRFRLVHGLYSLTANLAARRPLAIVVDDAQFADESSLLYLHHLAERLDDLRCALLVCCTSDGAARRPLVRGLRTHQRGRVLELRPLSREGVEQVVRGGYFPDAEARFCSEMASITGGNPFLVHELAVAVELEVGLNDLDALQALSNTAPRSLRDAVERRLDDLGDAAHRLARAASVLGWDGTLAAAAHMADLRLDDAAKVASQLVDAGLFQQADPLLFANPMVAASVGSLIIEADRPDLHARAASALIGIGRAHHRVAPHAVQTRPAGDGAVVATLWPAASHALAMGDPQAAVRYLRRALAEPPPTDVRADLLIDLGIAEAMTGEPRALEHLEEAVATHGDRNRRAAALLEAGTMLLHAGRVQDAHCAVERASRLGASDDDVRVALSAAALAARQLHPELRPIDSRSPLEVADDIDVARPQGRSLLAYSALEAAVRGGPFDEARHWLELATAGLAEAELGLEADTFAAVGGALVYLGRPDDADSLMTRCLTAAHGTVSGGSAVALTSRRALARWHLGDVPGARVDAESAITAARDRWVRYLPVAAAVLAMCHAECGEPETGSSRLEDASGSSSSSPLAAVVDVARGHVELGLGDHGGALAHFERAGALAEELGVSNPLTVPWRAGCGFALAHLGEPERAKELADHDLRLAERHGLAAVGGTALHVLGLATGGRQGVELLEASVTAFQRSHAAVQHARALVDLGVLLLCLGRRGEAKAALTHAHEMSRRCGATALQHRAVHELELAGIGVPQRGLSLTSGERRVVELVVQGHTNRKVAELLFVSIKAVEWHLRNAYRKLGVRNRRELTALLSAEGGPHVHD